MRRSYGIDNRWGKMNVGNLNGYTVSCMGIGLAPPPPPGGLGQLTFVLGFALRGSLPWRGRLWG
jgi:hypothetical protein